MGLAGDQRGFSSGFGGGQRRINRHRVVAVTVERRPARSGKPRRLIGSVGDGDLAVDGDAVVVPHHDQMAQFKPPGQRQRFLADPFHQATVAGNDIGVVVDDLCPPARPLHLFGDGEPDRIGQTLPERASGGFDPPGVAIFGVACGARPPLAEIPDLIQRDVGVAGQIHQRIKQHRAMARRQDEAVAVGPFRVGRLKLQMFLKQHRRHVGHAHRHAGMAGIGRLHRIHRQHADGAGLFPMVGVLALQSCDIHSGHPWEIGSDR